MSTDSVPRQTDRATTSEDDESYAGDWLLSLEHRDLLGCRLLGLLAVLAVLFVAWAGGVWWL